MSAYREKFSAGSQMRIVSLQELEEFRREWKFHHKLEAGQLAFAEKVFPVEKVSFYHGGDVLYSLSGVQGIWHERCLRAVEKA